MAMHNHKCDGCDKIWSHDTNWVTMREDEYMDHHRCPCCGELQSVVFHLSLKQEVAHAKALVNQTLDSICELMRPGGGDIDMMGLIKGMALTESFGPEQRQYNILIQEIVLYLRGDLCLEDYGRVRATIRMAHPYQYDKIILEVYECIMVNWTRYGEPHEDLTFWFDKDDGMTVRAFEIEPSKLFECRDLVWMGPYPSWQKSHYCTHVWDRLRCSECGWSRIGLLHPTLWPGLQHSLSILLLRGYLNRRV